MEERYQLIDYYIKNLDPDEQRGIAGDLRDKFTRFQRNIIRDKENDYKNIIRRYLIDKQQIEKYLQIVVNRFIEVNERMIKNERYPLFKDPYNLLESMDWKDKLLTFMPESECNKIVGCQSFDDYTPLVYKKSDSQ